MDAMTFVWNIKNFEMCLDHPNEHLFSPDFSMYNWPTLKFCLKLFPGGVNKSNSNSVSLYIVKTSDDDEENYSYCCELGIITSQEKVTCYSFKSKMPRGTGKGLGTFLDKEKLLSSEKHIMLPGGTLTLYCEISIPATRSYSSCDSQLKQLSKELEGLLESENYCDLHLQTREKTFAAHKAVLAVRFPDLVRNMKDNVCDVKDIGASTMKALLHYIYSGEVNVSEVNLHELLKSNYKLPSHLSSLLLTRSNRTEITTTFHKTVLSFSWVVSNFSSFDSNKILRYSLIGDDNQTWSWLTIFLALVTDDKSNEYVKISIERYSECCKRVMCTIKVEDASKTFAHTFDKENCWILPSFFTKDMLESQPSFKSSDEISLDFEIALTDGSKSDASVKKELMHIRDSVSQIVEDLSSFQKDVQSIASDAKHSDITLIAGEKKYPAHKFMLCARFSGFSEMFSNDSAGKETRAVVFEDLDPIAVKSMLDYMYCDYHDVPFYLSEIISIISMYNTASKCKLTTLRDICATKLISKLSADTAGDILISATNWKDEELKKAVFDFVCLHPLEIASSKKWEETILKRSDIALEVLKSTLSHLACEKK